MKPIGYCPFTKSKVVVLSLVSALVVVARPENARAEQAAPAPSDGGAPPNTSDFNFDLTKPGEAKPAVVPSPEEKLRLERLERRVHLRRKMLVWHQAFGFITLATLAAANILGTLAFEDKYGSGNDTQRFKNWHLGLGIGASATFATSAALALFAPNPYPKPVKLDLALLHKVSMAVAAACFVAQLIIGPIMADSDGKLYQRNLAVSHLTVGWAAFGFMSVGTIAYLVK
jgi:hypothetical protein